MDQDSKRDIYDLIAELAKSANMDIDGTEFFSGLPENKETTRFQDNTHISETKVAEVIKPPLPHREYNTSSNINGNGNRLHTELGNSDSIEELTLIKRAALEEISQIKAELLQEIELAKNSVLTKPNLNVIPEAAAKGAHHTAILDLQHAKENTLIELQKAKTALLDDLENVRKIKPVSTPQPKKDFFDVLNIDELNKVCIQTAGMNETSQSAIQEKTAPIKTLTEEDSILHLQLRLLNEKIDELRNRNLPLDIVKELKQSDDRIVAQVKQTGESIVSHLAAQSNQTQTISGNTLIKWIGVANLLLLFLIMLYFIFQKMNTLSANQHTKKPVPEATSKPIIENAENNTLETQEQAVPLQNDIELKNETEEKIDHNVSPSSTNPTQANLDKKQVSTLADKQPSMKNKGYMESHTPLKTNIEKKTLAESPNTVLKETSTSTEMAKVEVAAQTPTSSTKKVANTQDVYFGED